ncbi:hypothetical protein GCM10008955_18710 [Deinococcus malanensis]|uniref:Uncharacterized protein n=1 Tax=Deinococcus malanensis TaxID=1706855 RepID=A0ABQ2EUF8_9DEIO|nr:hypothetical protein GCM10008955_18710 [Deinococcus malanensis]
MNYVGPKAPNYLDEVDKTSDPGGRLSLINPQIMDSDRCGIWQNDRLAQQGNQLDLMVLSYKLVCQITDKVFSTAHT